MGNEVGDGRVGIGTNTPGHPLHVNGHNGGNTNYSNAYFIGGSTYGADGNRTSNDAVSIYAYHSIMTRTFIISESDSRIKTEIQEFNDTQALELVNNIECKEYHYKDPLRRKQDKTIGFIAQQVKTHFPNAITITVEFIPDELRVLETNNHTWSNISDVSGMVKYALAIHDLDLSSNNTGKCRFYVSNDPSGNDEVMKEIKVEPDNKTFIFDESWNNVFFYGKEVNDFHTIDKNKIFQLHHPAIQQLSRLNDEKTEKIATLETELSSVKTQLASLEAKVNEILAKNA